MKRIVYKGKIWAVKYKEYEAELLQHLTSKDLLIVIKHGKPPHKVVFGVPHQAPVGVDHICENAKNRESDENAVSFALVAFTALKEHDIPCKIIIAAHSTQEDPNKDTKSLYCQKLFSEPTELIWECHGLGINRKLDLELSAGPNDITDTMKYGLRLASALKNISDIGIQKKAGLADALIVRKDGTQDPNGVLEKAGINTDSLIEARKNNIPSLHLEAKPRFRKPDNKTDAVTIDGFLLGHAIAQAIMQDLVDEELIKVGQSYTTQILNMTGAYHREIESKKEYQGRQLLELLQNADDEAEEYEQPGILIRLEENRLIVANHGLPFTAQGILSLMYSNNSPKIKRQRKIGYKGLGFRAILNWSDSIWIKSCAFSLEFSRTNAVEFLKNLMGNNPGLKEEIEKTGSGEYPIATLAAPKWQLLDTSFTPGYDTYIVINFSSQEVRENIQDQINELGLEVALFLNNLKTIRLESPERNETIERLPPEKDNYEEVRLIDDQGKIKDSTSWRIFKETGELPDRLKTETTKQFEYDLRIAISKNMDDNINRLFCYFKTEVNLPFPAIIHGTFELDGNRNHLTETKINEFLLERLAELMTKTAKDITESQRSISWDAMKLLACKGELDDKLEKMGFHMKLIASIKTHKLIPVLSNKYMSADEKPIFYDIRLAELLNNVSPEFPELSLYTQDTDIHALLQELEITTYKPEDLVKRLNKVSPNLDLEKRADLIILLVTNYENCLKNVSTDKMPRLFVDDQGQVIGANTKALLPPEATTFQLPDMVKLVFISSDLAKHLRVKASVRRNRALAEKLTRFNIQEYSAAAVIGRIVANTNRAIRRIPIREEEYIQKMVEALFTIFNDKTNPDLKFPEKINARLFTRKEILRNANKLCFGSEYSVGKIMDALYSGIDDTIFLAAKDKLGLGMKSDTEAVNFLKWVGVTEFPRIIGPRLLKDQDYDSDYEDYVLRNLPYPYKTDYGELYRSHEKLKNAKDGRSIIAVADIEGMSIILEKARFEDVIAWLHYDARIQGLFRDRHEPSESSLKLSLSGTRTYRNIMPRHISPYILWKLRSTLWIKTKTGKTVQPGKCCLSETLDGISPIIEVPDINLKDPAFKENRIDRKAIEYVLNAVGVSEDLSTLPTETVYDILTSLENTDPEGGKAKAIYRLILKSKNEEWDSTLQENEAHASFISEGKLLAKSDGKTAYQPVNQVYYVDNITFCREIMGKFLIAEIPRRSGKDRVKNIFGIRPLEDIDFTLTSEPEVHPINTEFSKHLEAFKPYVLVFRHGTSKFNTELNNLKRLKICLCKNIDAKFRFNNQEAELKVNPYEHIQPSGENTAYLLLSRDYKNMADLKKDIKFCDAMAEIISGVLKVDENRKDYRELFPKDREGRNTIIQRDLDDPTLERLRDVRQKFRDISELQKDFWQTILINKGVQKELFELDEDEQTLPFLCKELVLEESFAKEVFQGLDYDDLSNLKNLSLIKKIFDGLGITVKDFNLHASEQIDFNKEFKSNIASEKYNLQKRFQAYIYEVLKEKDVATKETFTSLLSSYEKVSFIEHYDVNENLDTDKEKCFDIAFQQEPFKNLIITHSVLLKQQESPLRETYNRNKGEFLQKIKEAGGAYSDDIKTFIENPKNKSLIYFGELDELVKRFYAKHPKPTPVETEDQGDQITKKKKTIPLNGTDQQYDEDDYGYIFKNIKDDLEQNQYDISKHDPSRPAEKPVKEHPTGFGGGYGSPKPKYTTETGFVGEAYVYESLVRNYGQDKVFWVSENAKRANVNPQGSDSYGYDIHYIDENNKLRYVEVKSSSSEEDAFQISPEEVRFGEQHGEDYEVIQVLNALDKKRNMRNLGNIFDYKEEESFNNNRKFKVENDGYRIRFK